MRGGGGNVWSGGEGRATSRAETMGPHGESRGRENETKAMKTMSKKGKKKIYDIKNIKILYQKTKTRAHHEKI